MFCFVFFLAQPRGTDIVGIPLLILMQVPYAASYICETSAPLCDELIRNIYYELLIRAVHCGGIIELKKWSDKQSHDKFE